MAEYLAPGVYIEEVSFRDKTIEGVSTSTAGFVGPTRYGPISGEPELLTSFADFERIYGGLDQLAFSEEGSPDDTAELHNYLAHAVRSFFTEGGRRLYVSRVYDPPSTSNDGRAALSLSVAGSLDTVTLRARFPGQYGDISVLFSVRAGQNVLAGEPSNPADLSSSREPVLRGVSNYDLVWISDQTSPISSPPGGSGSLYWVQRHFDTATGRQTWRFRSGDDILLLSTLTPGEPGAPGDEVRVITVNIEVFFPGRFPRSDVWENLTFHPEHPQSLSRIFADELNNRLQALTVPFVFETTGDDGPAIARILLGQRRPDHERPRLLALLGLDDTSTDLSILATLGEDALSDTDRQLRVQLEDGHDGIRPGAGDYEGREITDPPRLPSTSGLLSFENIADISIVAAPGFSFGYNDPDYQNQADQIIRNLIAHCERMRYRIAVIDSANGHAVSEVRSYRGQVDSTHAALYYPWVCVLDPITEEEIYLPPSGSITGIYARNDVNAGVHKAPANEVIRQAIGLEVLINKAQQDVLNPEGINCLRFFDGRGFRVWGARTISSDPEWKYVNLRRYFAFLERSIELGTQWVVFENNSDQLWGNVRRTIEAFLFNEWKSNHLLGERPADAFFVRCDRSTMTPNDIDNGRLICLVGVAPVRPAEFVIFRIGQMTADSQV